MVCRSFQAASRVNGGSGGTGHLQASYFVPIGTSCTKRYKLSSAKSVLPDMRRPESIRFEVCALIRLHGDAQGFGADRAVPSWHSVRATRYSGTKRSKARQIFRSLGRYRRQFHRYLPIPISSAGTDEVMPQIARVWICPPCSDLIDRESRDLASRTGLFDDLSMTKTSIRAVTRDRALGCKVCFPNTVLLFSPRLKFGLDALY